MGLALARVIPRADAQAAARSSSPRADEARQARVLAPSAAIYVLDGLLPGAAPALAGIGVRPVLSSLEEVREWAAFGTVRGHDGCRRRCTSTPGSTVSGLSDDEIAALAADAESGRAPSRSRSS